MTSPATTSDMREHYANIKEFGIYTAQKILMVKTRWAATQRDEADQ